MIEPIVPVAGIAVFAMAMISGGFRDLTTMTIPNSLVLWMLGAYVVLAPFSGLPAGAIALDAGVALAVLATGFLMFAFGWIGGGDAKLAAVAVLWLGLETTAPFLVNAALCGGLLTLVLLSLRRLPTGALSAQWVAPLRAAEKGVPYGVALAAAALLVLPQSHWFLALS